MEGNTNTEIRIYVACLAAYNNGILHGAWIDAREDEQDIQDAITAMLKASPISNAEEWAIHDYEGFEGISISEYAGLTEVCRLAQFIENHSDLGAALIKEFGNIDEAERALEDRYIGAFRSAAEFAEELTVETTSIPDSIRYYIDYDRMAADMLISDIMAIELAYNEVHLFWQH